LRPTVMRVGLKLDELFRLQIIDDPLHVLAVAIDVAGEPYDRPRPFRRDDAAKYLPAGACQTEVSDELVAGAASMRLLEHQACTGRYVAASVVNSACP
jgi:hypothetical protein